MTEKIAQALRSIDLLAGLPDPYLVQLEQFSMLRQIRAGETIFCQGEPSPYCFGIVTGQITIQRVPREKNFPPKTLSILGQGALFGEQSLFKDTPRTAMAIASQNGELVAIQGQKFRDWLEKDKAVGIPLMMGMLQNTLSRLRQTSHELSLVFGVGRALATDKPIQDRIRETTQFLRASLEGVDEIIVYKRSAYWDEFEPLAGVPESTVSAQPATALPTQHALVKQLLLTLTPFVSKEEIKCGAVALVPLLDSADPRHALIGFLWVASRNDALTFTPNILLLLSTVAVQFTEALIRQNRQDDQDAQSRLKQGRQSFSL